MTLAEPTTMLTDYLLGCLSGVLALRLSRLGQETKQRSILFWEFAFLATAIAAFVGGTFHGFFNFLGKTGQQILWKLTMILTGVLSISMLCGSLFATTTGKIRQTFL